MRTLRGKRVLVTGAARGIGRALAAAFASEGAEAVCADLDAAGAEEAAASIRAAGGAACAVPLDVTSAASVLALRDLLAAERRPLDVVVHNAGVVHGGRFLEVPAERHRATFAVNLLGPVEATRILLPGLLERPEAHLVFVASAAAYLALPRGTTYAASKWGLLGFADSLRRELALDGHLHVGVTVACPSYVTTGLFEGVAPPRLTRWLAPERVAAATVRAVRRNRLYVRLPWLVAVTPFLKGILPARVFEWAAALLGVERSMVPWTGRSPAQRGERERG